MHLVEVKLEAPRGKEPIEIIGSFGPMSERQARHVRKLLITQDRETSMRSPLKLVHAVVKEIKA